MSFDYEKIKLFWDTRAERYSATQSFGTTNLEENKEHQLLKVQCEEEKINDFTCSLKFDTMLDLGSGLGYWSNYFSHRCNRVVAVEYSEKMTEIAKNIAEQNAVNNIEFITDNILNYSTNESFDLIFISGVMIYIADEDITRLLSNIYNYSKNGTYLLLRDGTGYTKRHHVIDKYSENLKTEYSALYRTSKEYKRIFESVGFLSLRDEDMFKEGNVLNKYKETRLRIYLFKRN